MLKVITCAIRAYFKRNTSTRISWSKNFTNKTLLWIANIRQGTLQNAMFLLYGRNPAIVLIGTIFKKLTDNN